jgi:glycine/D-amino acid oxidase-like deaminating enzyme
VKEYAFDAIKLRDAMIGRLDASIVDYQTGISVESVKVQDSGLLVTIKNLNSGEREEIYADHVFNCTYSHINYILDNSSIELVPLKHEMTEMCLVDVPDELKKIGITVMCGPFFSVMPFPSAGLHSFSHVRYTPHYEWMDDPHMPYLDSHTKYNTDKRSSAWLYMQKDAMRYLPILSECQYNRSLWEVKTLLPRSETNDSRPILFLANHGLKGFHCVLGGKIDNIYDAVDVIAAQHILN